MAGKTRRLQGQTGSPALPQWIAVNASRPDAARLSGQTKARANSNKVSPGQNEEIAMANILVDLEKGIEIADKDVVKWFGSTRSALNAAPGVVGALATLATAVERPLVELSGVATNPLNIALDIQTVNDLKAVWPNVKKFLGTLGVKF